MQVLQNTFGRSLQRSYKRAKQHKMSKESDFIVEDLPAQLNELSILVKKHSSSNQQGSENFS